MQIALIVPRKCSNSHKILKTALNFQTVEGDEYCSFIEL